MGAKSLFFSGLQWTTLFFSICSIGLVCTSIVYYSINPPMTYEQMEQTTTEIITNGTEEIVTIINTYATSDAAAKKKNALSSSYILDKLPPPKFQGSRSTCWAFSTLFQLEYAYNKKLNNQYVSFSEQAYAIDAVTACKEDGYKGCPKKKFDLSTNTGYAQWLWRYSSLGNKVLPNSVCEYTNERNNETDWKCEGKEAAQAKNPLKFDVKDIKTLRTMSELKEALKNGPVSLSLVLSQGQHVIRVDNKDNILGKIKGAEIKQCPNDEHLCAYIPNERITADGEHVLPEQAVNRFGYHYVTIVGFNDNYHCKDDTKGAFIVRDSTPDSNVYGSHSWQYLMTGHTDWDERTVCPNPYNPLGWDSCVYMNPGPTGNEKKENRKGAVDLTATCLNEKYIKENVMNTRKPTEFECIDENMCDPTKRYFVAYTSRSEYTKNLFSVTFLEVDPKDGNNQKEVAFVDVPLDSYYKFIRPIQSQVDMITTNTTFCGYRSLPYSYLEKIQQSRSQDNWYGIQF